MKTLKYLIVLAFLISLTGCDKNDDEKNINPDVDTYIRLLKSNQYDSPNLPSFTYRDIPALLHYRKDTHIISDFPRNPISSFFGSECRLGVYVLWTIEAIRAESTNSDYLTMGFPSQNPVLALKASDEPAVVSDNLSHTIAAEAYYDWWTNNEDSNYDDFKNIDPLENTDYRWH